MDTKCLVIDSDTTDQKPECPAVMHSSQIMEDATENPIKIQEPNHICHQGTTFAEVENQFQPRTVKKSVTFFVSLSSDIESDSKDDVSEDESEHEDVSTDEESDSEFIFFNNSRDSTSDTSNSETELITKPAGDDFKTDETANSNPAGGFDVVDAVVQNTKESAAPKENSKCKKRVSFCSVPKVHIMRIYAFAMRQARLIERPERNEKNEENSIIIEGEIKLLKNKSLQDFGMP